MSSVPQGAFASIKVRENFTKAQCGAEETTKKSGFYSSNDTNLEHPLFRYSSKLMNSIWGQYNRYSVHNFKKNAAEAGHLNVFNNHRL